MGQKLKPCPFCEATVTWEEKGCECGAMGGGVHHPAWDKDCPLNSRTIKCTPEQWNKRADRLQRPKGQMRSVPDHLFGTCYD